MEPAQTNIQSKYAWWQWFGRAWALPYTIIGLLVGLVGRNTFQVHGRTIEILLEKGPVLWGCNRMGISAFTLGDCVLYAVPPCPNLRIHEQRHVRQYWVLGPFFLPAYYILLALWGYWDHPFEKDARNSEMRHCGSLYTGSISKPRA